MTNHQIIDIDMLLTIMDYLREAIYITDENGILIYFNKSAEILERTKKSELEGRNVTSAYPYMDYDSGAAPPSIVVLRSGQPRIDEKCDYLSAKGEVIHSLLSNYPYFKKNNRTGEVNAVFSIADNIEEMKERLIHIAGVLPNKYRIKPKMMNNGTSYVFDDIVGESLTMKNTINLAHRYAEKRIPVMICGETGTGKEMFAQAIHNASPMMKHDFVALNCAAIPDNLLESILFGTVKGAFTGATNTIGLFEKANNGTIFLDELNSMPLLLQAKILRSIQEKEIRRIGEDTIRPISCRVISAINKPPLEAINNGSLREDLFYRLSAGLLFIPPLRDRGGDISLLARYFLEIHGETPEYSIYQISDELLSLFNNYSWQGNIRELSNTIESAVNMALPTDNTLSVNHLPQYIKNRLKQEFKEKQEQHTEEVFLPEYHGSTTETVHSPSTQIKQAVEAYEKKFIENSLWVNGGNITKSANEMGLTRQGLDKKIKKYKLTVDSFRHR